MVDLNLPTPGQSPNWAPQLNTEIEKLNAQVTRLSNFALNIQDLGAPLDGVRDDTVVVQQAIDNWDASRGILKLIAPPGSTIRTDGWTVTAKSVIFDFRNCHIITSTTAPILTARGEWGSIHENVTASGSVVTGLDTSGFTRGDIVKVFSDDAISDGRPRNSEERPRQGEFAIVQSVNEGELRINPSLYDTYSNYVRIAKIIPHHVEFHFGTAEPVAGAPATGGQAMFRFNSLVRPSLSGKCLWNNAAFSGFTSCYMPEADIEVSELPSSNGYGVSSSRNVGGNFNIRANRVRHAYTDDTGPMAAGSNPDPGAYGRPMYDTIRGMSFSTSESSWNTHHGGIGHKFIGVIGTGVQNAADGAVFALRGRYHELHACSAHAAMWGIRIYDEAQSSYDTWARSDNHRVVGFTGRGLWNGLTVVKSNLLDSTEGMDVWMDGGLIETVGGLPLRVESGRVSFSGRPVFNHTGSIPPSGNVMASTTRCDVRGGLVLSARNVSSGAFSRIMSFSDSSPAFQLVNLDVEIILSEYAAANTATLIEAGSAIGRVDLTLNTLTTASKVGGSARSAGEFVYTMKTLGLSTDTNSNSSLFRPSLSGSEFTLSTNRSADPHVTILLYNTTSRSVTAFSGGAFSGQEMTALNYSTSTANVTIRSNASNASLSSDIVLAPGSARRFIWDGSTSSWRPA